MSNKKITECYRSLLDQANFSKSEFVYIEEFKKFLKLNIVFLNKHREDKEKDYREYRAETETEFIYFKVFKNFISVGMDEREMYVEPNSIPVAYFNKTEPVTIEEIAEKFKFEIPKDYAEFD